MTFSRAMKHHLFTTADEEAQGGGKAIQTEALYSRWCITYICEGNCVLCERIRHKILQSILRPCLAYRTKWHVPATGLP